MQHHQPLLCGKGLVSTPGTHHKSRQYLDVLNTHPLKALSVVFRLKNPIQIFIRWRVTNKSIHLLAEPENDPCGHGAFQGYHFRASVYILLKISN